MCSERNQKPVFLVTIVVVLVVFYGVPLLSVAWFFGATSLTAFIAWVTSWHFPVTLVGFPVFLFIWFMITCVCIHFFYWVMYTR